MNRWTVEKDDGGWWWAVNPDGERVVGRISREGAEEAAELFFKASAAKGWTVRRGGRDWDVIDPDGHTVGVRISEVGAVELMVELAEAAQAQADDGALGDAGKTGEGRPTVTEEKSGETKRGWSPEPGDSEEERGMTTVKVRFGSKFLQRAIKPEAEKSNMPLAKWIRLCVLKEMDARGVETRSATKYKAVARQKREDGLWP